ncbi:MAG: hypothetical protein AAGF91_00785 [Actinomycetota bacterium]
MDSLDRIQRAACAIIEGIGLVEPATALALVPETVDRPKALVKQHTR